MDILLTGFSGTLGTAVARTLIRNGRKLRVLLHGAAFDPRNFDFDVEIVWGSLSDHNLFDQITKNIEVVVHCAWEGRGASESILKKVNLDGTINLIKSAERNRVRTFIHVSSVAVYGLSRPLWGKVLDENQPLVSNEDSLNPYPWIKTLIEKKCADISNKLGMNLIIIRPGLLFSRIKAPAKKLITFKSKQYALLVGGGTNHLPYIHVKDVAEMISLIINKTPKNGVYNCVPTMYLPADEFLNKWGNYYNYPVKALRLPPLFLRTMNWSVQKLKSALRRRNGASSIDYQILTGIRNIQYSAEKAIKELGWQDKQTKSVCQGP